MSNIISSISLAANHFIMYAVICTIPFLLMQVMKGKINLVRLGINYVFLFYVLCVIGLVFFPLPTMAGDMPQSVYGLQVIPFHFICDIVRETPFVWNQPQTYLAAVTDWTVLQVVFNVVMTVPFGMYLRYNFRFDGKKTALASLLFSSMIEIGQLTGLFFMVPFTYRLCDVDDLIMNTLGGVMGYVLVCFVEKRMKAIPAIEKFDVVRTEKKVLANI